MGGCSAFGRASDRHATDIGSIPRCGKGFSPRVNFQCSLFYVCPYPLCAVACINICAHVKDPVVCIRLRRIMETQKHQACTIGWEAPLCRSWLSPGKTSRFSHARNPKWDNTVVKKKSLCKVDVLCGTLNCRRLVSDYILTSLNRTGSFQVLGSWI